MTRPNVPQIYCAQERLNAVVVAIHGMQQDLAKSPPGSFSSGTVYTLLQSLLERIRNSAPLSPPDFDSPVPLEQQFFSDWDQFGHWTTQVIQEAEARREREARGE